MAADISAGSASQPISLTNTSNYTRYCVNGLVGSMYVTKSGNLGSTFKYHFQIINPSGTVLHRDPTSGSASQTKPTSTYSTLNITSNCSDIYVGGDAYSQIYGYWFNDSSSAIIDNASLTFSYTTEYRTRVILNYNGGTFGGSSSYDNGYSGWTTSSTYTFNIDSDVYPVRDGYEFLGWSASSSATSPAYGITSTYYAPTGQSNTLYAVWKAQTYTISYNTNGGTGSISSQTKTHGTILTLTTTQPTRVGYEFLGWSTSPTATAATYASGGSFTANASTTLYAVWKAKTYSVVYNGNGGIHNETGGQTWEDTVDKFTFGQEYDISLGTIGDKGFKRSGYNLLGWNSSFTAAEPLLTYTVTEDVNPELFAIWELGSNIRVFTNGDWKIAIPYIYENGEWKLSISKVFDGENWRQ